MANITTRAGKGSALTHAEMDANFNNLNNDKAEASSLGTASSSDVTTSATDTTAGRLLKVGDFGVGGDATLILDFNDINESSVNTATSGALNAPLPSATFVGARFTRANGAAQGELFCRTNSAMNSWWVRAKENYFSEWAMLYGQNTILGTVSQSGGVPTGAIIERGSNANGGYVKYADGTLICTKEVTSSITCSITSGSVYANNSDIVQTLSATFTNVQGISIHCDGTSTTAIGRWAVSAGTGAGSNSVKYRIFDSISSTATTIVRITVIGQWF